MNCQHFDERIQQLLDDRQPLATDPGLRAHAMACSNCEENLALYGVMLRGAKQLSLPPLKASFAREIVSQVQAKPIEIRTGGGNSARVGWLAPLAAIAALLLLAVGIGAWSNWNGRNGVDVAGSTDSQAGGQATPGVVGIAVPGLVGKSRSDNESPRQAIAPPQSATAGYPAAPPYFAVDAEGNYDYGLAIQSLAMQLPGAVGQFEAVETYPGVRPIRESFSTAFETLLKTIPGRADVRGSQPPQASSGVGQAAGLA